MDATTDLPSRPARFAPKLITVFREGYSQKQFVSDLDATGLKALEDLMKKMKKDKSVLILSGDHAQPLVVMDQSGFLDQIGQENIQADIDLALHRAREILGLPLAQ